MSRRPRLHALTVVVLGVGLAAGATLYNLEDALLFRPLRVPNRDRVVRLEWAPPHPTGSPPVAPFEVATLNERRPAGFERFAAVQQGSCLVSVGAVQRTRTCTTVTPEFLHVLGVEAPFRLTRDDTVMVSDTVARELGAQGRPVLGGTISLAVFDPATFRVVDQPRVIAAVAPRGFRIPGDTEIWVLPSRSEARMRYLELWALTTNAGPVSPPDVERLRSELAGTSNGPLQVRGLREVLVPPETSPVLVLLWVVAGMVAVGWIHAVGLFTSRVYRSVEAARVRVALGASPRHLVLGVWLDAALLSMGAWVVAQPGVLVATHHLSSALPFARSQYIPLSGFATVAMAVACCAGCLLHGITGSLAAVECGTWKTGPVRQSQTRMEALRAAGIAVTVVLVYCALLVVAGYHRTYQIPLGFETNGLLSFEVVPSPVADWEGAAHTLDRLLKSAPEVAAVASVKGPPFGSYQVVAQVEALARAEKRAVTAKVRSAGGRYFETLGVPLLVGRDFHDPEDDSVAIVNRAAADRLWPERDGDAVGERLHIRGRAYRVVGMCGDFADVRRNPEERGPQVYYNDGGAGQKVLGDFVVRVRRDAESTMNRILDEMAAASPAITIRGTSFQAVRRSIARDEKAYMQLMLLVVCCALVICMLSVYAGASDLIRSNIRTLAIHVALGATWGSACRRLGGRFFASVVCGGASGLVVAGAGIGAVIATHVPRVTAVEWWAIAVCATTVVTAVAGATLPVVRTLRRTEISLLTKVDR